MGHSDDPLQAPAGASGPESDVAGRAAPDRPTSGTVLCIEDQPVCMDLVEAILAGHGGIRLIKAYNGRDGVRLAETERPDVVLLDMRLPDIGGLDVVRELSLLVSQRRLRIVLLTGEELSIDVLKALSLGAHDYWRKPLDTLRVRASVLKLLDEVAAERSAE